MKTTCIWMITLYTVAVLATVSVAQVEEIAIGNTFRGRRESDGHGRCISGRCR